MTHERDIERLLDRWFADGPTQAPDRVVDAVADQIGHQHQRPAWRLDWRHTTMTPTIKFGAAIAAVLLIALVGFGLLRGGSSNVGGPSATPSPTPSLSANPSADAYECGYGDLTGLPGCAGLLAAGEHRSTNFDPALSVQTPDGWENNVDIPAWYEVRHGDHGIILWSEVVAAFRDDNCLAAQKTGFGGSVQDWIDYLTSHAGLVTTEPVPVTLGTSTGQSIDISVAPDWKQECPAGSVPEVLLFIQALGSTQDVYYGDPATNRMHLTFVDVGGRTVVIAAYGPESADGFAAVVADVQPVIDFDAVHACSLTS